MNSSWIEQFDQYPNRSCIVSGRVAARDYITRLWLVNIPVKVQLIQQKRVESLVQGSSSSGQPSASPSSPQWLPAQHSDINSCRAAEWLQRMVLAIALIPVDERQIREVSSIVAILGNFETLFIKKMWATSCCFKSKLFYYWISLIAQRIAILASARMPLHNVKPTWSSIAWPAGANTAGLGVRLLEYCQGAAH